MKIFKHILLVFLVTLKALGKSETPSMEKVISYEPWFTGTFLAPTPVNMQPGHPAIEPSITWTGVYGSYDGNGTLRKGDFIWGITPLIDFQFGITENFGIEVITAFGTNFSKGKSSTRLLDTTLLFGYQLLTDEKESWTPNLRLFLEAIFPSGRYDRLDPIKVAIDFSGQGAYFLGPNMTYQKSFSFSDQFFVLQFSLGYFFPTRAPVRDISIYGGTVGTRGTIRPGQSLTTFFSGQYSLSQRWGIGYDFIFLYQTKTSRFKGNPGLLPSGEPAKIGLPSSYQISLAPTMEYSFSSDSGLIFGTWFTLKGRNSSAFISGFIAFICTF